MASAVAAVARATGENAIGVRGVGKIYESRTAGTVTALRHIDLAIAGGEFVSFLGPSGCGKTTLLRVIAGLEPPSDGYIEIGGSPIDGPADGVGFVFQSAVLLPWRTILSNVLLPAEVAGRVDARHTERARSLLELTGLGSFASHFPRELSGGMRQRAAICRALLMDPHILLMDEPFGALDAMTRDAMNEDLFDLWRRSGKTVLFVTHDIAEAIRLASRIVVMTARPGHVSEIVETGFGDADYESRLSSPRFTELLRHLREHFRATAQRE